MILILILYAILAVSFTIGKMLLDFLPPLFLIGLRMLFSGIILLSSYYLYSDKKTKVERTDWYWLFFISIVHIFIPYATEFIALQSIAPSCAALMFNFSPFFTALFSYWYFNETMTPLKWLGAAISFSGLIYFLQPTVWCWGDIFGFNSIYALLLGGVASSAYAWVVIRQFVKNKNFSILFINGIAMLLGGIESFSVSFLYNEQVLFPWQNFWYFVLLFLTITCLINFFYNFYGYLLKRYTATFLSFMGLATPLIVAFFDWLFLGISIHNHFFIALFFIAVGVYLFYQEELKQGYTSIGN
ncbi:DMT family transporter [Candidatus Dependentiae bacterium]|nr:DMT family transporter [Candidatus Dependentiae bacterium]